MPKDLVRLQKRLPKSQYDQNRPESVKLDQKTVLDQVVYTRKYSVAPTKINTDFENGVESEEKVAPRSRNRVAEQINSRNTATEKS